MTITAARIEQLRRDSRRLFLKAQREGTPITHAEALRAIAVQEGYEGWEQMLTHRSLEPAVTTPQRTPIRLVKNRSPKRAPKGRLERALETDLRALIEKYGFQSWSDVLETYSELQRNEPGHRMRHRNMTPKRSAARRLLIDASVVAQLRTGLRVEELKGLWVNDVPLAFARDWFELSSTADNLMKGPDLGQGQAKDLISELADDHIRQYWGEAGTT